MWGQAPDEISDKSEEDPSAPRPSVTGDALPTM